MFCRETILCIVRTLHVSIKKPMAEQSDGSVVKSTDCYSEGPEFNSQQTQGGEQPSVMRSMLSSGMSEENNGI